MWRTAATAALRASSRISAQAGVAGALHGGLPRGALRFGDRSGASMNDQRRLRHVR